MPDYLIITKLDSDTKRERIIRAKNEAQAIRHVIADTVTIDRATLDDAIRVGKIEIAAGTLAGE
jgi:hypothetical protein